MLSTAKSLLQMPKKTPVADPKAASRSRPPRPEGNMGSSQTGAVEFGVGARNWGNSCCGRNFGHQSTVPLRGEMEVKIGEVFFPTAIPF